MSRGEKLRIPEDVVSEVVDGEAVVLNLKTGVYYSLNQIGTRMWQLIEQLGDEQGIRDRLLREYEVDSAILAADFARLIGDLTERGLVSRGE